MKTPSTFRVERIIKIVKRWESHADSLLQIASQAPDSPAARDLVHQATAYKTVARGLRDEFQIGEGE